MMTDGKPTHLKFNIFSNISGIKNPRTAPVILDRIQRQGGRIQERHVGVVLVTT